jgi:hypothetical protein
MKKRTPWEQWSRTEVTGTERTDAPLSPIALRCLDRQLGEGLGLAVWCRLLSDSSRSAGDLLTAVALDRLFHELTDQVAILTPLVAPMAHLASPPTPEASSSELETDLADLCHHLSRAALVAQTDAMTPGLEMAVAGLLWALAGLYRSRRELLLVCTMLDLS